MANHAVAKKQNTSSADVLIDALTAIGDGASGMHLAEGMGASALDGSLVSLNSCPRVYAQFVTGGIVLDASTIKCTVREDGDACAWLVVTLDAQNLRMPAAFSVDSPLCMRVRVVNGSGNELLDVVSEMNHEYGAVCLRKGDSLSMSLRVNLYCF